MALCHMDGSSMSAGKTESCEYGSLTVEGHPITSATFSWLPASYRLAHIQREETAQRCEPQALGFLGGLQGSSTMFSTTASMWKD